MESNQNLKSALVGLQRRPSQRRPLDYCREYVRLVDRWSATVILANPILVASTRQTARKGAPHTQGRMQIETVNHTYKIAGLYHLRTIPSHFISESPICFTSLVFEKLNPAGL